MGKDILVEFFIFTLKSQACEYSFLRLKETDPLYSMARQEIDTMRCKYGKILFSLLKAALPTASRHKRTFRTKYVDEVDIPSIENNIISAANKVLNYASIASLSQYDLKSVQPVASKFLDKLAELQYRISNIMDEALLKSGQSVKQDTKKLSNGSRTKLDLSVDGATNESDNHSDVEKNDSAYSRTNSSSSTESQQSNTSNLQHHREKSNKIYTYNESTLFNSSKNQHLHNHHHHYPIKICLPIDFIGTSNSILIELPPASYLSINNELIVCLSELDHVAAEFEFEFVQRLSKQFRTVQQAEDLQLVTVLFSETLMWSLAVQLLTVEQLADRDPCILLCLPRLAVLVGCRLLPDSPIGANRLANGQRLPFVFASSRHNLSYLCRQLNALRPDQLCRLTRWLGPKGLPNLIQNQATDKLNPNEQIVVHDINVNSTTAMPDQHEVNNKQLLMPTNQHCIWKTGLSGLHRLYKSVSNVADCFCAGYPSELRFILQKVIEMHDTSNTIDPNEQLNNDNESTVQNSNCANLIDHLAESGSDEIESEIEIKLDMFRLKEQCNENFENMSKLFNWTEIIRNTSTITETTTTTTPTNLDLNLNQIFKTYQSFVEPTSQQLPNTIVTSAAATVASFTSSSSSSTSSVLVANSNHCKQIDELIGQCFTDPTTTTSSCKLFMNEQKLPINSMTTVETGVDVVTFIGDQSSSDVADNSEMNIELDCTPTTESPLIQHLRRINLGISLDGNNSQTDRLLHYLPIWQPDVVESPHSAWSINNLFKIESDNSDSDSSPSSRLDDYKIGQQCAHCCRNFSLIRRRHHCRRCGHIFCARCANRWEPVEGLANNNKPVRICIECYEFLSP